MKINYLLFAFTAFFTVSTCALLNQGGSNQKDSGEVSEVERYDFVVQNVRVFDGLNVIPLTNVYVSDGKIVAIDEELSFTKETPVISGEGKTLVPGLIDSHSHPYFVSELKQTLAFGVTTTMSMLGDVKFTKEQRELDSKGQADLFGAGFTLTVPGGHGDFGPEFPTVKEGDDVAEFVKARFAEGSDYLKIIIEDGYEAHPLPTLSAEQVKIGVDTAHSLDKIAVAHIGGDESAEKAINAKVDAFVHSYRPSTKSVELAAKIHQADIAVVPTLAVRRAQYHAKRGEAMMKEHPELVKYLWPGALENLVLDRPSLADDLGFTCEDLIKVGHDLHDAKVDILVGTDVKNVGTAHGISMYDEMQLLNEAGMTPVEVLKAATYSAAKLFRLDDRGQIKAGLRADFILVNGDPTTNINNIYNIENIWREGVEFDRQTYLQDIEQFKEQQLKDGVFAENQKISDFNGDEISSERGFGFHAAATPGSSAQISLKEQSLLIAGEVAAGDAYGAVNYFPGDKAYEGTYDFTKNKGIRFKAKGDNQTYFLAFFYGPTHTPAVINFIATAEWTDYRFDFTGFSGLDWKNVSFVSWGQKAEGQFSFQLDDIELYTE